MYTAQMELAKKQFDIASKYLGQRVETLGQTAVQIFQKTSGNVGTLVGEKMGQQIPPHVAQAITAGALFVGIGGSFYLVKRIFSFGSSSSNESSFTDYELLELPGSLVYLIGGAFRELPTSQLYNALNARHTSVGFSVGTNGNGKTNGSTTILRPYTSALPLQILLGLHTQILNYSYESAVEASSSATSLSSSMTLPSTLTDNNEDTSNSSTTTDETNNPRNDLQQHYFYYDNQQKIVASQASDVLAAYAYRLHSLSSLSSTVSAHYASYLATSTCSCGNMHIRITPLPSIVQAFTCPIIQNGKPFVPVSRTALTLSFKQDASSTKNGGNSNSNTMNDTTVPTQDVIMGPILTSAVDAATVQQEHHHHTTNNNTNVRVSVRAMHCGYCQDSPVLIMEIIGTSNGSSEILYAVDTTRLEYTARYIVAKKEKEEYLQQTMESNGATVASAQETAVIVLHPWDGKHIDTVCSIRDIASLAAIIDGNTNALGIMPLSNDLKPVHWNNATIPTYGTTDEGNARKPVPKGIGNARSKSNINGPHYSSSSLTVTASPAKTLSADHNSSNNGGIPLPNRQAFSPESPQINRSSLNQGNPHQPQHLQQHHHHHHSSQQGTTENTMNSNNNSNSIFGPSGGSPGEDNKFHIPNLQNMSPSMQAAVALAAGRLSLSNAGAEQRRRLNRNHRTGPASSININGPQISLVPGRSSRDPQNIFQAYGGAPMMLASSFTNPAATDPLMMGPTVVTTTNGGNDTVSVDTNSSNGTTASSQSSNNASVTTTNDSVHIPSVPSSVTATTMSQSNLISTTHATSSTNIFTTGNQNRRFFDLTSAPITYGSIPPPSVPRPSSSLSTVSTTASPLQFVPNPTSWAEMNVAGSRAQANHTIASFLSNNNNNDNHNNPQGSNDYDYSQSSNNIIRPSFGPAKANVTWTVSRLGGDWRWNNFGPWNGGPSSFGLRNTTNGSNQEEQDHYSNPNVSPAPVAALRFDPAPMIPISSHNSSSSSSSIVSHMVARPPSRGRPVVVDSGPSPSLPPLAPTNPTATAAHSNANSHSTHIRSSVSFAPVPIVLNMESTASSSSVPSQSIPPFSVSSTESIVHPPRNESFITVQRGSNSSSSNSNTSSRHIIPPVELQMSTSTISTDDSAEDSWFLETAGQPPMEALIGTTDDTKPLPTKLQRDIPALISPQVSPMKGYTVPSASVLTQSTNHTNSTNMSSAEFGRIARKKATPIPQKRAPNGGMNNTMNTANMINPALASLVSTTTANNHTDEAIMNLSAITFNSVASPDRSKTKGRTNTTSTTTIMTNRSNASSLSPTKKSTTNGSTSNGSTKSSNSPPNAGPVLAARRAAAAVQAIR